MDTLFEATFLHYFFELRRIYIRHTHMNKMDIIVLARVAKSQERLYRPYYILRGNMTRHSEEELGGQVVLFFDSFNVYRATWPVYIVSPFIDRDDACRIKTIPTNDIFPRKFGAGKSPRDLSVEQFQRPIEHRARENEAAIRCKVASAMQCCHYMSCRRKPEKWIQPRLEPLNDIESVFCRQEVIDHPWETTIQEFPTDPRKYDFANAVSIDRIVRLFKVQK